MSLTLKQQCETLLTAGGKHYHIYHLSAGGTARQS